jgi:hypothetical protein
LSPTDAVAGPVTVTEVATMSENVVEAVVVTSVSAASVPVAVIVYPATPNTELEAPVAVQ